MYLPKDIVFNEIWLFLHKMKTHHGVNNNGEIFSLSLNSLLIKYFRIVFISHVLTQ